MTRTANRRLLRRFQPAFIAVIFAAVHFTRTEAADLGDFGATRLGPPALGDAGLQILAPSVLEITLISTRAPSDPSTYYLDLETYPSRAPGPDQFSVMSEGSTVPVKTVGFRRRVAYAPLKVRDLRIGNHFILELSQPLPQGAEVRVVNPSGRIWPTNQVLSSRLHPLRFSAAIHVNQVGYAPGWPKKAFVGYYLGNLGELPISGELGFELVDETSGLTVFRGALRQRRDQGFPFSSYQQVWEADFSAFKTPGRYRVMVPNLGGSLSFRIHDGAAAAVARTYALGLYHQRCGHSNHLPFTRFTHDACHTAPAEIPTTSYTQTQAVLESMTSDYAGDPFHTAPQLKSVDASLFPWVNRGRVDVSGGHHDAGDYSKYTINSAALIHYLVFAADALPGAGDLDNLGIPESGDGISDLLQEAKWEADFLLKMQDADGGFYFLVYPRDRPYELDVLPDHGDPQVVFPKTTAVTAAAVAALAQIASSPRFKHHYPTEADRYLRSAGAGWAFLQRALSQFGRAGAYQKISHYGDTFQHNDELAWAAAELFGATGNVEFQDELMRRFDPADSKTWRWGWWKLYEGYGCALRSLVFVARTGRLAPSQLNAAYLARCQEALMAGAQDQLNYAKASAYAVSFPIEDKRFRNASWFFPLDRAFDLTVAYALDPQPAFFEAIISNLGYEAGANPVNTCFLSGLGRKRPIETVDQYAQNDRRVMPPSGKPIGSIQAGFGYVNGYWEMLGLMSFPPDGEPQAPYPYYDRWGDSFNLSTEFVAVNQARSLATAAWLMAQTALKDQAYVPAAGRIVVRPGIPAGQLFIQAHLEGPATAPPLDPASVDVIWEATGQPPAEATVFNFKAATLGDHWIEAEATFPDGRRIFGTSTFNATEVVRDGVQIAIQVLPATDGLLRLQLNAVHESNQAMILETSADLTHWSERVVETGRALNYVDTLDPHAPSRFYRVRLADVAGNPINRHSWADETPARPSSESASNPR